MEAKRRFSGHFQTNSATWRFWGTWDVPEHLCYSLGFALWWDIGNQGQGAGWLYLGHGAWTVGGGQGTFFLFPERTQWRINVYKIFVHQDMWSSQAPTGQGAKPICPPQQLGPAARLAVGEEGPQPGDRTAYEQQSSPSAESILATSQGLFGGQRGRTHQELNQLNPAWTQGCKRPRLGTAVPLRVLRKDGITQPLNYRQDIRQDTTILKQNKTNKNPQTTTKAEAKYHPFLPTLSRELMEPSHHLFGQH